MTDPRTAELRQRWDELRTRVARAAAAAGRSSEAITVVAVTKTWPASDVAALHAFGVQDIGENRAQELLDKVATLDETGALGGPPAVRWHFIGQLQRNKAAAVARTCAALHTFDRAELAGPLARGAAEAGNVLEVFLQVSLDGDARRGGAAPDALPSLAEAVAACPELRLVGLMAVPPLGADPDPAFATLAELSARLRRDHPGATAISAGMSGDLEIAVSHGATHLRVGTGLMGSRP
jgi:PLP dependent protein